MLVRSAAPMTKNDSFYDWPCGEVYYPVTCPIEDFGGTTDQPYASWQVGAGALDIRAALAWSMSRRSPPRSRRSRSRADDQ